MGITFWEKGQETLGVEVEEVDEAVEAFAVEVDLEELI